MYNSTGYPQFFDRDFTLYQGLQIPPEEHSLANIPSHLGLETERFERLAFEGQEEPHGGALPQQIPAGGNLVSHDTLLFNEQHPNSDNGVSYWPPSGTPSLSQPPYSALSPPPYSALSQPPYSALSQPPYLASAFSQPHYSSHLPGPLSQPPYSSHLPGLLSQPPYSSHLPGPPTSPSQLGYFNSQPPSGNYASHNEADLEIYSPTQVPLQTRGTSFQGPNNGPGTYTCHLCDQNFTRAYNRDQHIQTVHYLCRPHQCPATGCSKIYSRKDDLWRHWESTRHGPSRPYGCDLCKKRYLSEVKLQNHRCVPKS
ncbi:hypothetical protein C2E23DRAFT_189650 [Lenzites betulinus]|nr:hypothetical protein C2E23DRAFT_189650 [Lenzites betulinus]